MARDEKLYDTCKEWMQKQDKLELFRDYNDYLEPDTVKKFIDYCKDEIANGNYLEPGSYLYDFFTGYLKYDWFNPYEQDQFHEKFYEPFMEEHPEIEDGSDEAMEVDEILRELMYELDLYDANIEHFNTDYHFYILTNPDKTALIYDYPYYRDKRYYLKAFQKSQGWTEHSTSMRELYDGAYDFVGMCIKVNMDLFDFINLMKATQLTIKKGSYVFLFNPFNGSGGCDTEMAQDWTIRNNLKDISYGVDSGRHGPYGYTPDEVYGRVHSFFDKNRITFKSFRK